MILLEIAKKLPLDTHLLILGSGPEEEKVKELANSKPNLHFLGYQSKEKTIELIRGSDVLVQPSIVEGISSTILEAMACQTPVIATNVGGNREIIEHNKTGILIEPDSHEKFFDEIIELLSNTQKSKSMCEEALKKVQQYDWSNVGNLYLKLYKKLLN